MPKFRKIPQEVNAELISTLINRFEHNWDALPGWVRDHYEQGDIIILPSHIEVQTNHGFVQGNPEDMLIEGSQDIYPCTAEVFKETYEKV